jgi:hypothetical protein
VYHSRHLVASAFRRKDHLLDYVFLWSILPGYGLLVPDGFQWRVIAIVAIRSALPTSPAPAASSTARPCYLDRTS